MKVILKILVEILIVVLITRIIIFLRVIINQMLFLLIMKKKTGTSQNRLLSKANPSILHLVVLIRILVIIKIIISIREVIGIIVTKTFFQIEKLVKIIVKLQISILNPIVQLISQKNNMTVLAKISKHRKKIGMMKFLKYQ